MSGSIAGQRLRNQRIAGDGLRRPADVVAWLGAVQAQEYEPATWGLGLRMRDGAAATDIRRAFDQGRILRTHVMRPTWHFVTPAAIHWLLALTAPRVHRILSSYNRRHELDAATLVRGTSVIERALRDRQSLTRTELGEQLTRRGLRLDGIRLGNLLMYAELEAVICSGPRRGNQSTYALLADRAPKARRLSRDEALGALSRCYFRSHGPATTRDFAWWSGLTVADARRGLEMNRARREEIDGHTYWTLGPVRRPATRTDLVHLLPIYDEYLVAYRDRAAVPHGSALVTPGSGMRVAFRHALVIAGQVAGTWHVTRSPRGIAIDATPSRQLTASERRALARAAARYEAFVGAPVELAVR
jgi:winged helix DNA-binding protein